MRTTSTPVRVKVIEQQQDPMIDAVVARLTEERRRSEELRLRIKHRERTDMRAGSTN